MTRSECAPDSQDESIKQILLFLDERLHFIIEDVDALHVFMDAAQYPLVMSEMEKILAENAFVKHEDLEA